MGLGDGAAVNGASNGGRCPLCGNELVDQSRIREEIVPATVPDYFTRTKAAPYRRVVEYVIVKCSKDHRFKRQGSGLYGMQHDL